MAIFRYRGRDLRGVNANVVVGHAAHVREMLQMTRTDASVLDHDVPISLLGYDRQSIGSVRSGKVGHDLRTRRLIDASGMQAKASPLERKLLSLPRYPFTLNGICVK